MSSFMQAQTWRWRIFSIQCKSNEAHINSIGKDNIPFTHIECLSSIYFFLSSAFISFCVVDFLLLVFRRSIPVIESSKVKRKGGNVYALVRSCIPAFKSIPKRGSFMWYMKKASRQIISDGTFLVTNQTNQYKSIYNTHTHTPIHPRAHALTNHMLSVQCDRNKK